jgi:hypothetical protein
MSSQQVNKKSIFDLIKKQDYLGAKELMDTLYHMDLSSNIANTFFREELIGLCLQNNSIEGLFLAFHPFSHHENNTELFNTPTFICGQMIELKQYSLLEKALLAGYINFKDLNKYSKMDYPDLFHYIENHTEIKLYEFSEPLNFEKTFKNNDIDLVKKAILTKQNKLIDLTHYFVESKNIKAFKELQNNSDIKLDSNSLYASYDKFFTHFSSSTPELLNLIKNDFTPGYYVLVFSLNEAIKNNQFGAIDYLFTHESEKMPIITEHWLKYMRNLDTKYTNDPFSFFNLDNIDNNPSYFIDVLLRFKKHHSFIIDEEIQKYFINLFVLSYDDNQTLTQQTLIFLDSVAIIENTPTSENVYHYIKEHYSSYYPGIDEMIEKKELEKKLSMGQKTNTKIKI